MDMSKSFYEYRPAAHLRVTDEDAADFLQSQFTNELRPFAEGQCTYGLWLDVKAKVIADSVVLCEGDETFRIISERCSGEVIAAHLERHIIADDVAIEHRESGFAFQISAQAVSAIGWELPERGRFIARAAGILFCVREGIYNMVLDSELDFKVLQRELLEAGFSSLSDADCAFARIAEGIPQVPDEIGASDLPGEGELERDAISFTKGCYLGQEVVARMHNIGKPQRRLFIVRGVGEIPERPIALYNADSKQVGELRSAYKKADFWCGVAILKTRFTSVGGMLYFETNEVTVICPLREGIEHD